jgi:hypothetical protein
MVKPTEIACPNINHIGCAGNVRHIDSILCLLFYSYQGHATRERIKAGGCNYCLQVHERLHYLQLLFVLAEDLARRFVENTKFLQAEPTSDTQGKTRQLMNGYAGSEENDI